MGQQRDHVNENEAVSYEEALEKAGTGKFQYYLVITGGLIIFSSYVSVGAVSYILPAAQCDLHMDSQSKGTLLSAGFVGLIISCHFWGFLSDLLGRRYILIRCLLVDGLLYFVTSITPYYSLILILRLINGFASSGGVACVYVYVGEFITNKYRTKYLMTAAMIASFSYFITPTYAWLIIRSKLAIPLYPGLIYKSWRLFYAVNGIPSLICVVLIYFLPESPKFLLVKEKPEESIEILKTIHEVNGKKDEFLVKDIRIDENEKVATLESNTIKVIAFLRLIWKQTAPLFKEPHRMNFGLICITLYLAYFSNGGMYLWLPETMNRLANFRDEREDEYANFCDVVQYSKDKNLVNLTKTSFWGSYGDGQTTTVVSPLTEPVCNEEVNVIIYFYLGLLGVTQSINLGFIATISKVWNKKYILVVLTFLALLSSIAIQFVNVTDIIKYDSSLLIIFTGAIIPITNSMVVEYFPANLRGMAGCLTLMCCRLGTVTANIIAGKLIDHSCPAFVWSFVVAMSICLITVLFMPKKYQDSIEEKNSTHV